MCPRLAIPNRCTMKKDRTTPCDIKGDWDWCGISTNRAGGWVDLPHETPKGDHVWSFIGNGTMLSKEADVLRYVADYHYDRDRSWLAFDGWKLDDRGER